MPVPHAHSAACQLGTLHPILLNIKRIAPTTPIKLRTPLKNVLRRTTQLVSNEFEASPIRISVSHKGIESLLRLLRQLIPALAKLSGFRALRRIDNLIIRFHGWLPLNPNWPVLIYFRRQRVFTPPPLRSARPQVCGWSASINDKPTAQVEILASKRLAVVGCTAYN